MRTKAIQLLLLYWLVLPVLCSAQTAPAQIDENCTVSVLNRNVRVSADGSWVLPNIPSGFGQVKARATCIKNGITTTGESDLFIITAFSMNSINQIELGTASPIPDILTITPGNSSLTSLGQTVQLTVTASYPDGSSKDVTGATTGTNYTSSNPAIAAVSSDGTVTATGTGVVVLQATNDGTPGMVRLSVVLSSADSDGDQIPDAVEVQLGLDPRNPIDAQEDFDRDGLTNLKEYQLGTAMRNPDTDSDGVSDGDEVNIYASNPLLTDTDGDGIPDGVEVQTATSPSDRNSYDLKKATATSLLQPDSFSLTTTGFSNAFQQLSWNVSLIDGKTTLNLTTDPRTNYVSSDLFVCNFGSEKGKVFAGSSGTCIITISNNTLSVTVSGTVQVFQPTLTGAPFVPGYANNVDVSGNYAYIAAGAAGLQIMNLGERTTSSPSIVASVFLPGNANDVVVVDKYAYVAGGTAGLHIINVENPLKPILSASLDTSGEAWDVVVKNSRAYVADGSAGLVIIDVSSPQAPVKLGGLALSGTTKGVDGDVARNIAVLARGSAGLSVINVANPASPQLLSTLGGGEVRDVVIKGNFAMLADFSRGFASVDLSIPATPVLRFSSNASGSFQLLQDVAVLGNSAVAADPFFFPVFDVTRPDSPQLSASIDYRFVNSNYHATGVAMDSHFFYFTAVDGIGENGATAPAGTPSVLFIGKYSPNDVDNFGIAPSIQIISPTTGTTIMQGDTVTVKADAIDDVDVASVTLLVNDQEVFMTDRRPIKYTFTAPAGSTLRLGATAVDVGGNVGTASVLTFVTPDPEADADGDGFPDVLEALFGSNATNSNSMPDLSSRGDVRSPAVTVSNAVSPSAFQPTQITLSSNPVSVSNSVLPNPPLQRNSVSNPVSVLNATVPSSGQPQEQNAFSSLVSVLNAVGPSFGQPQERNVFSVFVSLLNAVGPSYGQPQQQNLVSRAATILNAHSPFSSQPMPSTIIGAAVLIRNLLVSPLTVDSPNVDSPTKFARGISGNNEVSEGRFRLLEETSPNASIDVAEGQTLEIRAQTQGLDSVRPVKFVEFAVNGVPYAIDDAGPFELLFTVPSGMRQAIVTAKATMIDDTEQSSPALTFSVQAASRVSVAGRVTDESGTPVAGATVTIAVNGLETEFFDVPNFQALPSLDGIAPVSTSIATAINARNPESVLGTDPFGTRLQPDYAIRFHGWLKIPVAGTYRFFLGADEGARLKIGGATVTEIPAGVGKYQESIGEAELSEGLAPIEVTFYESVGNGDLQLSWAPPNLARTVIRPDSFAALPMFLTGVTDSAGGYAFQNLPSAVSHFQIVAGTEQDRRLFIGNSGSLPASAEKSIAVDNVILKPTQ